MYHKILVPLDGSWLAEQVLPHVETLARCTGATVILLRVPVYAYQSGMATLSPYRRAPFTLTEEREEQVKKAVEYLEYVKQHLAAHGVNASVQVEDGNPVAETIIEFAESHEVDLIAMSTHGYSGLPHLLFGSVAEVVLRRAGKPVLLFRPNESMRWKTPEFGENEMETIKE
jgi:nucleotide-binding universal stress UspA family protein